MPDILSAVGDALGLSKNSSLQKMRIESWNEMARTPGTASETFNAFINPDEFTINYNVHVASGTAPGTNSRIGQQLGTAPLELTLKFFLDGTGVYGYNFNDVSTQIEQFYKTVGYDHSGNKHNIRFLRIYWGSLKLLRSNHFALDCILKSASVQYKLFKPDGTPLRAIINATFTEALSDEVVAAEFLKNSPDLTHSRIVKEGDTLPAMVYEIYGDIKYYLEVAKVNGLQNFRNLHPGQQIFFPPFDKNSTKKK